MKTFLIEDYLKGRPIYPAARRILSFLFSVSITSFLFEKIFFKYTLIDITDYKGIYDFFVKGSFFVPFCLYVGVHYILDFISRIAYGILLMINTDKYQHKILKTKYSKAEAKRMIKAINKRTPYIVSEPWLLAIYQYVTDTVTAEQWNKWLNELEKAKRGNEDNFKLIIKTLVTICIYLAIVPYFGWKLFLIVLLLLTGIGIILFWLYIGMEVLPLGIQKIHADVTEYFARQQAEQDQTQMPE